MGTLKREGNMNLYITITFGGQVRQTLVVEADEHGDADIEQSLVFTLNKELVNAESIVIRAFDKRSENMELKGDPLIGKAKLTLRPVPMGEIVEQHVELERTTSGREAASRGRRRVRFEETVSD